MGESVRSSSKPFSLSFYELKCSVVIFLHFIIKQTHKGLDVSVCRVIICTVKQQQFVKEKLKIAWNGTISSCEHKQCSTRARNQRAMRSMGKQGFGGGYG